MEALLNTLEPLVRPDHDVAQTDIKRQPQHEVRIPGTKTPSKATISLLQQASAFLQLRGWHIFRGVGLGGKRRRHVRLIYPSSVDATLSVGDLGPVV